MKKLLFLAALVCVFVGIGFAQPRPLERTAAKPSAKTPPPSSVPAKYEGGMFGFSQRLNGTLKLDDANSRVVFYGQDEKELFGIPYDALLIIYPQSKSVTSTTGNVFKNVPLPGASLAGYLKEKRQYLIIQFDDPDVDTKGTVNFKFDNKEILDSVLLALADKAALQQRGDAFYKPKNAKSSN
jgi:hypothetical protein